MKPMLAAKADLSKLRYPLLASPKLDGVRCLIVNGQVMSRSLKPIPNQFIQDLYGRDTLEGLDGELIVGPPTAKDVYQKTVSGVMARDGMPEARFFVFDDYTHATRPYGDRIKLVGARLLASKAEFVGLLQQDLVPDEEELLRLEHHYLGLGYEGVMLRQEHGRYKFGRSTVNEGWLLKLKRFNDGEAEILGLTELYHNSNEPTRNALGHQERSSKQAGKVPMGVLGALQVRDTKTGVEFEIGTGFTEQQRHDAWRLGTKLVGQLVKYRYQAVGMKDKPRFPVFLGLRDRRDL